MEGVPVDTAIVVLDIQRDFVSEQARMPVARHQAAPMIREVNKLIDHVQSRQMSVIYIGNEFEKTQVLPNLFRRHAAMKGTQGAMLDERLHVVSDVYFPKKVGNALTNVSLGQYLRNLQIQHLVVAGVFAEGCVLATARGALKTGYKVTVLSDAVAGATDGRRDKALIRLDSMGAHVMETKAFLKKL